MPQIIHYILNKMRRVRKYYNTIKNIAEMVGQKATLIYNLVRAGCSCQTAGNGSEATLLVTGCGLLLGDFGQLSSQTPDFRLGGTLLLCW